MSALAISTPGGVRARVLAPLALVLLAAGGALGFGLARSGDASAPVADPAAAVAVSAPRPAPPEPPVAVTPVVAAPGYVPLYRTAAREFGVSWLLLASIHSQETAFSTADTTYEGRNFAGCCAGPMQFNVRDGSPSMWQRFGHAFERAPRPASYPHATARHPSVYDDFDSVMAAGSLLAANGASEALDASAWRAAYSYYGYDANGVDYANQVLARAVTWSRSGFDPGLAPDPALVAEYEELYGGFERARLEPAAGKKHKRGRGHKRDEPKPERVREPRHDARETRPERPAGPPAEAPSDQRPAGPEPPKPLPRDVRSGPPPRTTTVPEAADPPGTPDAP